MGILGIPNTRVSDQFVRYQLLGQVQSGQFALLSAQNQLSTGEKFQLPSEDPVAALQVIGLQRIIQRNTQIQTNLTMNQSCLGASDAALSQVSNLINDIKGSVLAVTGTTASETQRMAAAQQTQQALQQLIDTANQQFRGRYLFAGSTTAVKPFSALDGNVVRYDGNENRLASFGSIDMLFDTNVQGNEVFGAVSDAVRGTADLGPALTFDTRLADLNYGQGVARGSISVSDGHNTRIVDLSKAETIGDVARLICGNPPEENVINAEVGARGLVIEAASGNLSIQEVGSTTALDLGILTPKGGVGGTTVVGTDVHPAVTTTTPLADVLGARARAVLRPLDAGNDFIIQADHNGAGLNGVTVSLVDDGSVQAGSEKAVYDAGAKTLTIYVQDNVSNAQQVIDAVNHAHQLDAATMPFTGALDPLDQHGALTPIIVSTVAAVATHDGSGTDIDMAHGLQIVNGNYSKTIDLSKAVTIEDLTNALNDAGIGLQAAINQGKTGLDVRTLLSGADFAVGENGGITATQLGIRTFGTNTSLEQLNFGGGVSDYEGPGVAAQAKMRPGKANSDFVVEARSSGTQWNDFAVNVQAAADGDPERIDYDPANRTIDIYVRSGVTTANQVVAMINTNGALSRDFAARIDPREDVSNNGTGTVSPVSQQTSGGTDSGVDFSVTLKSGDTFEVDIHGAKTVGEVIALINNNPINLGLGSPLWAHPAAYGNGIELSDYSAGMGTLTVTRLNASTAAIDLGLIPAGQESRSGTPQGNHDILTGADTNLQETTGMFTALARLEHALTVGDTKGIQRGLTMLEEGITNMNFARAELGVRQQGVDVLESRLANDTVELKANLSQEYDADLAQVMSDLIARQAALQASLQATAKATQMTLLNYL